MAATNRQELLDVTRKEFRKLIATVAHIDARTALQKHEDDTSIKDVIAHRAHWINLFLGWYADGLAGKAVYFPAEGYKWNDLKRYNSDLRARQADLDWAGALDALNESYDRLMDFIDDHLERDLYGGPMNGANNHWTPGRWAEAAGPSHFRSASKFIRSILRKARPEQVPTGPALGKSRGAG